MKTLNPYMYEPERGISACSDELDVSGKKESKECSEDNELGTLIGVNVGTV